MSELGGGDGARGEVSVLLLRALLDVLRQRGIAVEGLFAQATDVIRVESASSRLSLVSFEALLARAARMAEEPALGLWCGLQAAESSFGVVGPLVSHSASLRCGIELMARYHSLLLEGSCLHVSERMGVATVRCEFPRTSPGADQQLSEFIVAGLVRTVRSFGCGRADLRGVCFEHRRPSYAHTYAAAFQGAERFACGFTGVEVDARALDRPHIHREPELELLLCAEAERALHRLGKPPSTAAQVLDALRRKRLSDVPEMACIARELGLSVRSLRRRLEEEGTSFRALTQSRLQEAACAMLRDPRVPLQSIAHALGFAHCAAFARAFRRWTQLSPAQYRATARPPSGAAASAVSGAA